MSASPPPAATPSGLARHLVDLYGDALRMTHNPPPELRDAAQRNLATIHAMLLDYIATLEAVAPRSPITT